jgi:YHS domain-containing protein
MTAFTTALHDRLQAAAAARATRRGDTLALMEDRNRCRKTFESGAGEMHRTLIRPMVEEVGCAFDNCTVEHYLSPVAYTSCCRFARTDVYPATVELSIGIRQGSDSLQAELTYDLKVIPMLMSFTRSDSWPVDLASPALDVVRARLAEWLLRFTDTYLSLESDPNYQDWEAHIDPVCGMHITGAAAAGVIQQGPRKIYFCSEDCRERFEAHPALYLNGVAPLSA